MGDEGIRRIIVYANLSADEKAKIATTFPEAELVTDRIGEAVKAVIDDESLN